jgi:hypothetical protein
MYIRMIVFQTNGNKKDEATKIMDRMLPKIGKQPGCKGCDFLVHEKDGRYALLVYWETEQHAETAAPIIGPEMTPSLNRISTKPVDPILYKVYLPSGYIGKTT